MSDPRTTPSIFTRGAVDLSSLRSAAPATPAGELSASGQPMSELMKQQPFASIVASQRIGTIKPTVPVLVTHSALDDVIPYAVGKQMAKSWCGKGANVRLSTNVAPLHVGGMVPHVAEALPFFEARFAGLPQLSNCWLI